MLKKNSDYQLFPNLILDLEKEKKVIAAYLQRYENIKDGSRLPI